MVNRRAHAVARRRIPIASGFIEWLKSDPGGIFLSSVGFQSLLTLIDSIVTPIRQYPLVLAMSVVVGILTISAAIVWLVQRRWNHEVNDRLNEAARRKKLSRDGS